MSEIATAMKRAAAALERRPSVGLRADAAASASWVGGLRVEARHPTGHMVLTDVGVEIGGSGDQVSPGWLVRAGVAACAATTIAGIAAERGIALAGVDVSVTSRSDARGYLGLREPDGGPVDPSPLEMAMHVKVRAPGVPEDALRDLVAVAQRRAPMTAMVERAYDMATTIEVEAG